jgi:acyl-CoA synthetase (AMP-forming)/AMP-acid ligase II
MTVQAATSPDKPRQLGRIDSYVEWYGINRPDACSAVLDGQRLSYAELRHRVREFARALLASGVGKGDRIAVLAPPGFDYWVSFLAATSIGVIWVGLNPRYRIEELTYALNDSEPVLLFARSEISGRDYTGDIRALASGKSYLDGTILLDSECAVGTENAQVLTDFLSRGRSVSDERLEEARLSVGGRDPCMIVYTSGSTGKPKGALLHHAGIIGYALVQNAAWPVNDVCMLNYFPINHVACVVDVSVPTLVAGGKIVFMEQFDVRGSLELIQNEKVTIWGSVPSVFQMQLADPFMASADLSQVQLIAWGGAKMPVSTIERLLEFGKPLATNYGMTESSSAITMTPPTVDMRILSETVGWASEGSEIRLVDAAEQNVQEGEVGQVLVRSPYNMLGYWHRPDATAQTLSADGWMSTGDTARRNPDGSYAIVGRLREMYKSGGYNVYPREIEEVLESHPAVETAAVVSVSDPVWQEVGVAYVQVAGELRPEELRAFCGARLANYKVPKHFVCIAEMPLLPIGKIDKVSLGNRAANDYKKENQPT